MNKYFHEDVHDENMDIAEKINKDSRMIEIPKHQSFEELLDADAKKNTKKSSIRTYRNISKIAVIAACFLTVIVVGGMFFHYVPVKKSSPDSKTSDSANAPRIAKSYDDIYRLFRENDAKNIATDYPYVTYENEDLVDYADADNGSQKTMKSGSTKSNSSNKEYSKTNIQTENIDEADTIKTNGDYIFTYREVGNDYDKEIVISKVDGNSAKTVSTISLTDSDNSTEYEGMYVYEDRLIIIITTYTENRLMDYVFGYDSSEPQTVIYTYDISTIDSPALLSTNKQDGALISSRMKGAYLYTVSNKSLARNYFVYGDGCIPKINGQKESCGCIYIPEDISAKGFIVVTALDAKNPDDYSSSYSVVGDTDQLYASNDNLYIINNTYADVDLKSSENPFKNKKITENSYDNYDKYIYERIEERYPDVDTKKITKKVRRRDVLEVNTIDIMKFSYNNGNVDYIAESTVEGHAYDNMFFDEKDGYLRFVATHCEEYATGFQYEYYTEDDKLVYSYFLGQDFKFGKNNSTCKVIVLNDALKLCGQIEGLAKNEEIYSARYLGDYGYFVTFEQTDPLFTVDFSDMKNPKIISELKMPGFSSYLHFYSDDLLFGLGEETIKGSEKIKLEMYDISEKDAKQKSKVYVGNLAKNHDYYSPALNEYKALLINPEKNYIGFYYNECDYSKRDYTESNHYALYQYTGDDFSRFFDISWEYRDDNDFGDIRGFYIDNYFYIVDASSGIRIVNLETYKKNPQVVYEKF